MTSPRAESPASAFAGAFLAELVSRGIRDVVLSPGSRSQALALAAGSFEAAGLLRLHVRIDERSAGFLALGLALESRIPVVVVTTSGTAAAELHPAVLEASHSGVALIVVTADRPEELRGIGSNQTTVQTGIFGTAARSIEVPAPTSDSGAVDLATEVLAGIVGPVHVNLSFRDPLSSTHRLPKVTTGEWRLPDVVAEAVSIRPGPLTVVVAGTGAGPRAETLARELGAPLLAEVASGARFGPNLVAAYRDVLTTEGFGDRVERVIVLGHPTLSREVPALIQRGGVETVVVRGPQRDAYNPARSARIVDDLRVEGETHPDARAWVGSWVVASRDLTAVDDDAAASLTDDRLERAAFARAQLERLREPVTRRMLVDAVWAITWPHDRLMLAASRLVRDLDRVAPGKKIPVFANRGLAGIDGTIATATGIALASPGEGVTRVLIGDLAALHDAGSLLATPGERMPRMQVIVGNDGGGAIFDTLEVAETAEPAVFERVMSTPRPVDFAALAAAYGWEYRLAATRADLDDALSASSSRVLIEVPLDR